MRMRHWIACMSRWMISLAELKVAMVTPAEGDGRTIFEGRLDQFTPQQFIPSWSEGTISTSLNGHYLLSENEYHVILD